jgi:hypothetical protein
MVTMAFHSPKSKSFGLLKYKRSEWPTRLQLLVNTLKANSDLRIWGCQVFKQYHGIQNKMHAAINEILVAPNQ